MFFQLRRLGLLGTEQWSLVRLRPVAHDHTITHMTGVWVSLLVALGITEMSRAGQELPRNHWSIIGMELLTVHLYKSYFLTRKLRTKGQEGTTPLSMMPRIAQPLPVTRCGRDVTAESQAFQPERNELPLLCRASRREKKGKPNTTEPLSNSAQCVVITSKIQALFHM